MEIEYSEDYDNEQYSLIEVTPSMLENIIKDNSSSLLIKGNNTTFLCSSEKSYELKYLETSNSLLLLKENNKKFNNFNFPSDGNSNSNLIENSKEIIYVSNHLLECNEVTPKKYQFVQKIKYECSLNYNENTGKSNILGNLIINYFFCKKFLKIFRTF
jgi:hypothetical protein